MDYEASPKVERRRFLRFALSGELPGVIVTGNDDAFDVLPVDVSEFGLGLLLNPGPKLGDTLFLRINPDGINPMEFVFTVRWTSKESSIAELPGLSDLKHCGLELVAPIDINLVEFLASFGGVSIEE